MTYLYVYVVQIIGLFGSVKVINGPLDQVHFVEMNIITFSMCHVVGTSTVFCSLFSTLFGLGVSV